MPYDNVTRDGFASGYGRFYALPGRTERVEGSQLRRMFLPKLTPEGNKYLRDKYDFIRGQLKHYGVEFEEKEFSGNGTLLLKKALQAGKCDKVPDHITKLQKQLHAEWLDQCTAEQLSSHPAWVMEKFFLTDGQPDRTKTTTVAGIPLPPRSSHRASELREAASKVPGLHHETGYGAETQTIFMGWDQRAVAKAAKGHAAAEAKKLREDNEEPEAERAEMHTDYLKSLKKKKNQNPSPVGSYIIDCEEIEGQWPDEADDLSLNIHLTEDPNVFKVDFDFGILEGVMIVSANASFLLNYCTELEAEREAASDDDRDEAEYDKKPAKGAKRKAAAPKGRGRPPKKVKTASAQSMGYMLRLRCRETGESMIYGQDQTGNIKFKNKDLASFTATASLPCVGENVKFTGRKTSDQPARSTKEWNDYSESAYERERVGRWR